MTPQDQPLRLKQAALSVRGAAIWAMGGQYLSFAIQFFSSVVISRFFLAPAEVGLFSIALAAAMMVAILQDFGLTRYIAGLHALDAHEIARCSSVAVIFSWTIGIAIAAGAPAVASFYGQPGLTPMLGVIALSYLFSAFSIVPCALLAREMAFSKLFAANVASAALQGAAAIGLAMAGYSALALAWAMVAAAAAKAVVTQTSRPALPLPPRFGGLADVLRFGAQSSYLFVIGAVGSRSADLIVGKLLNLAATGIYSRATGLATRLRSLVSGAIGGVLYPALARLKRQGEPLDEPYLRIVACFTAATWPTMAGLAICADPLVEALFGPRWAAVVPVLQLIAIGEMLFEALPLQMEIPILHGEMWRLTRRNMVDTAASIALLVLGASVSVELAAASRIAYGAIWFIIYVRFVCGLIGLTPARLVPIYAKGLAATAAAIAPLAVASQTMADYRHCGIAALAVFAVLGGLCWLASLSMLRHPLYRELADIFTGLRRRRRSSIA